jgi:hypothetical protein
MTTNPDEIDRAPREEISSDSSTWDYHNQSRPATALQALMEASPGSEPESALEEVAELRTAVFDCFQHLGEEDRFILEAALLEGISMAALGRRLGVSKSQAHRLTERAKARLERILLTSEIVRDRVGAEATWNAACRKWLLDFAPSGAMVDADALRLVEFGIGLARDARLDADDAVPGIKMVGDGAAAILDNQGRWSVERMERLLCSKQADYGPENILAFGIDGIVIRLHDKVARYEHLTAKGAAARNESLADTLDDMVGYAVVAAMVAEGTFTLPLESEIQ